MNTRAKITKGTPVATPAIVTDKAEFTAADYLAIERMVGNKVSWHLDGDCLLIRGEFPDHQLVCDNDQHIAGLRRFRQWESATPDWKEQVRAALATEALLALAKFERFGVADWIACERHFGREIFYKRNAGKVMGIYILHENQIRDMAAADAYGAAQLKARAWENANPDWPEQIAAELDAELLTSVNGGSPS